MSTTLIPPDRYAVQPHGRPDLICRTLAETAAVLRLLALPSTVEVVTGHRRRSLTDRELCELRRCVRVLRLRSEEQAGVGHAVGVPAAPAPTA